MDELQNIQDLIYIIRGQRVMLDRDIAAFYGVETKRLNEKVKRNPRRGTKARWPLPEDPGQPDRGPQSRGIRDERLAAP